LTEDMTGVMVVVADVPGIRSIVTSGVEEIPS
jgi:hypothetical protein